MRLALIQLCSGTDIKANLKIAGSLIRQAVSKGACFVATPEMTNIIQRSPKALKAAITPEDGSKEVDFFSALAKELKIDLLIGSSAFTFSATNAVNRSLLFSPEGNLSARYDKIHLFDVTLSRQETWKESSLYQRGNRAVIAELSNGCLLYTSPSPRDQRGSRMPSSA